MNSAIQRITTMNKVKMQVYHRSEDKHCARIRTAHWTEQRWRKQESAASRRSCEANARAQAHKHRVGIICRKIVIRAGREMTPRGIVRITLNKPPNGNSNKPETN